MINHPLISTALSIIRSRNIHLNHWLPLSRDLALNEVDMQKVFTPETVEFLTATHPVLPEAFPLLASYIETMQVTHGITREEAQELCALYTHGIIDLPPHYYAHFIEMYQQVFADEDALSFIALIVANDELNVQCALEHDNDLASHAQAMIPFYLLQLPIMLGNVAMIEVLQQFIGVADLSFPFYRQLKQLLVKAENEKIIADIDCLKTLFTSIALHRTADQFDDLMIDVIASQDTAMAISLFKENEFIDKYAQTFLNMLHYAATFGQLEFCQFLVKRHYDVNAKNSQTGETALQCALFAGQTAVVEYLISVGAKPQQDARRLGSAVRRLNMLANHMLFSGSARGESAVERDDSFQLSMFQPEEETHMERAFAAAREDRWEAFVQQEHAAVELIPRENRLVDVDFEIERMRNRRVVMGRCR